MSAILYPVAESAEAALHAPRGHAVRAREAEAVAGSEVRFATELVGPAFPTREAALEAYAGRFGLQAADLGWGELTPVAAATGQRPQAPSRPVYREGRRWPKPPAAAPVLWRLAVSYWRVGVASPAVEPPTPAARSARRSRDGGSLGATALNALARQPLRAVKPQQPLDIGLFEVRPPEAPDTLIPDE